MSLVKIADGTPALPPYFDANGFALPPNIGDPGMWSDDALAVIGLKRVDPLTSIPTVISRRQFFEQLALTPDPTKTDGSTIISEADAEAAMEGTIPPAFVTLLNGLPTTLQFDATMKLKGAGDFDRTDQITLGFAQAYGWTSDQLAAFWQAASAL